MVVQKFVSKENWVGSRVVPGMKTIFFAIFDPIWTHILAPKDSNKEFFKQNFSFQSIRKTELLLQSSGTTSDNFSRFSFIFPVFFTTNISFSKRITMIVSVSNLF